MSRRAPRVERPRMFVVADAAVLLDMAPETIRRLLAAGKLPGTRVGGRWRIPVDVIDRLLAAQREAVAAAKADSSATPSAIPAKRARVTW